jgi:putative acetyltransferase
MDTEESDAGVVIRRYHSDDADGTLAVFLSAVTVTASADYSPQQIAAWARPEKRNVSDWDEGMRSRNSLVAFISDEIAGFSDVSDNGYIDMMFVSPQFARRGVARQLLTVIEARARECEADHLSADVSITARKLFENHGFDAEVEQHPSTAGVQMTNFHMTKPLVSDG